MTVVFGRHVYIRKIRILKKLKKKKKKKKKKKLLEISSFYTSVPKTRIIGTVPEIQKMKK